MMYTLPELGYEYDALESFIDAQTMEIHHSKHHAAYVAKLNAALEGHGELATKSAEQIICKLDQVPEDIRTAVRNNGGGHVNHSFFWQILKPNVAFKGEIAEAINAKFGGLDKFKEEFLKTAVGVFGSGWAWLVIDSGGDLSLMGTPNQDNPISSGYTPVMGVDVWEHAYYLKYQNRRPDYVQAIFNVMNWEKINEFYVMTRQTAKSM
ncbi:MAG: superoxide dismutase [candidate division Zixibacteria bacterium]|nr:superoxide dismutase [candidate division Zixibacteria bacterium]MDH3936322.1 superoxide dismutase [candidate division Zixibacteria bacterium]MDH4034810.1 superoxide dismutase [candidate division Zixibacteria bacterium]